jgi:hypothetical protein
MINELCGISIRILCNIVDSLQLLFELVASATRCQINEVHDVSILPLSVQEHICNFLTVCDHALRGSRLFTCSGWTNRWASISKRIHWVYIARLFFRSSAISAKQFSEINHDPELRSEVRHNGPFTRVTQSEPIELLKLMSHASLLREIIQSHHPAYTVR